MHHLNLSFQNALDNSGTVVYSVIQSLVPPERVGVVELQQVCTISWKFMAATLHCQMTVLAVNRQDLSQVRIGNCLRALLYISRNNRACLTKQYLCH